MSITKVTILSSVNSRLLTEKTDIDAYILSAIQKIVSVVPGICEKTGTVTIVTTAYSGALPTDFVSDIAVTNSSGQALERSREITDLLAMMRSDSTAGTPIKYSIFGSYLYVQPPSSGGHTLTLFYEYADTSADTITMPDCAKETIIELVCAMLERERGVAGAGTEQTAVHETLADKELLALQARYNRRKRT